MRTVPDYFTAMYCCIIIVAYTGCTPSNLHDGELSVSERREDFSWPEGKHAAISLTFDDARISQVDNGLPILDEYGANLVRHTD